MINEKYQALSLIGPPRMLLSAALTAFESFFIYLFLVLFFVCFVVVVVVVVAFLLSFHTKAAKPCDYS